MKNVTVTWDLPTQRESGFPLNPADIANVEFGMRVVGAPDFTVLGTVLPTDPQTFAVADVDIGDWEIRLVVVDTAARRSADVIAPFTVPDETNPGVVVNVNVTLSP